MKLDEALRSGGLHRCTQIHHDWGIVVFSVQLAC